MDGIYLNNNNIIDIQGIMHMKNICNLYLIGNNNLYPNKY